MEGSKHDPEGRRNFFYFIAWIFVNPKKMSGCFWRAGQREQCDLFQPDNVVRPVMESDLLAGAAGVHCEMVVAGSDDQGLAAALYLEAGALQRAVDKDAGDNAVQDMLSVPGCAVARGKGGGRQHAAAVRAGWRIGVNELAVGKTSLPVTVCRH